MIVDYKTGKVAKTEPITGDDDLATAKAQAEAMAKAKISLRDATAKAIEGVKDAQAANVVPAIKSGHPVAAIAFVKNDRFQTVSLPLD